MGLTRVQSLPSLLPPVEPPTRYGRSSTSSLGTVAGSAPGSSVGSHSDLLDRLAANVGHRVSGQSDADEYNYTHETWLKLRHKGGRMPPPPTKSALLRLLHLCGVDTSGFGQGGRGSLNDLWDDLTAEDGRRSRLVIDDGWPVHVVERVVLKLKRPAPRFGSPPGERSRTERSFQVLAEETNPKPELRWETLEPDEGTSRLPLEPVGWQEDWKDAAMRCAESCMRHVCQKPRDKIKDYLIGPQRVSHEVQRSASHGDRSYPGLQTIEQYHLVTYNVKLENPGGSNSSLSFPSPLSPTKQASTKLFTWAHETDMDGIAGSHLWAEARAAGTATHSLSSVLLGLEGSAPGCESPFGMAHDATGASSKVSAVGNRKWRAYKLNCARDVPNEVDGMRMTITRQMFDEFIQTCAVLRIHEASDDLGPSGKAASNPALLREHLEDRFMEQELFRQVLGGSTQEARRAVEWMKEYRSIRCFSDSHDFACASVGNAYVRNSALIPKEQLRTPLSASGGDPSGPRSTSLKDSNDGVSLGSVPQEMQVKVKDTLPTNLGLKLPMANPPRWAKVSASDANKAVQTN